MSKHTMQNVSCQNVIKFPEYTGIKCNMMPFIQGDPRSLPLEYQSYAGIIAKNFIKKNAIGYLTIHESYVEAKTSQRGYNSHNSVRNVHIEVGISEYVTPRGNHENFFSWGEPSVPDPRYSWGTNWGKSIKVTLESDTRVLIANSMSDTCMLWDVIEKTPTPDGDLSHLLHKFKPEEGILMKKGELYNISIFTPHECINQVKSGVRQFIRIVGDGVKGREDYFTINPLLQNL